MSSSSPCEFVRTARDPDATLLECLQITHNVVADSAGWDSASSNDRTKPQIG